MRGHPRGGCGGCGHPLRLSQTQEWYELSIKMMDWLWYQQSLVSDLVMTPASCEVPLPPGARVMLSSLGDSPGPVAARQQNILEAIEEWGTKIVI